MMAKTAKWWRKTLIRQAIRPSRTHDVHAAGCAFFIASKAKFTFVEKSTLNGNCIFVVG